MPIQIGQILEGKYVIDRLIGQGGMGAVYEARNIRIQRRVAIKVLSGPLAQQPDVVARFEREAQAAGRIGSDHIIEILDLGALPDGDPFIVMEYLDGEPLSARIKRLGWLGAEEARDIVLQLLAGVSAAHRAGIVHRDLKPDNVFILREKAGRADFVKIIDFGISKFKTGAGDLGATQAGVVMGTPLYMSPEQVRGEQTDFRTDIYSIGIILHEALTGQPPFTAATYNELIMKIVLAQRPAVSSLVPNLPLDLCAAIDTSLARDRELRFASAEHFAQSIGHGARRPETHGTVALAPPGTWGLAQGSASSANWSNTEPPPRDAPARSRLALGLGLVGVVALVVLAGLLVTRPSLDENSADPSRASSSSDDVKRIEAASSAPAPVPMVPPPATVASPATPDMLHAESQPAPIATDTAAASGPERAAGVAPSTAPKTRPRSPEVIPRRNPRRATGATKSAASAEPAPPTPDTLPDLGY